MKVKHYTTDLSVGETYWCKGHSGLNDYGSYVDVDAVFKSLHDISGIRILVYFPKDVDKIENCLRNHPDIDFLRRVTRGPGIAKEIFDLRNFLLRLKKATAREPAVSDEVFPGYRADHFHVKPRRKEGEEEVNFHIEIQVATVVMNAWLQVEHDIVYKAQEEPGSEKRAILDTLNGIVMIGENALRQKSLMTLSRIVR